MAYYPSLNPQKALIWRIVHRENIPWILENGLHPGNSETRSSSWISIGNEDLISKRATHPVPVAPGGTLNDYVPFYFTPFSVMLRNINTGWGGIKQRQNEEIVILVSDLHHVREMGLPFLFTDMHAYYQWASYYRELAHLDKIDWEILQQRDFKRDPEDPRKFERYQAEALVHGAVPIEGLRGIVCHTQAMRELLQAQVTARNLSLTVHARPDWYF